MDDIVMKKLQQFKDGTTPIFEILTGQGNWTWSEVRSSYMKSMEQLFPVPDGVYFESVNISGVPTLIVTPKEVIEDRTMLYIHGGGYVHGGVNGYKSLVAQYALSLKSKVYLPDYRQAPEFPFPTPIDDVFSVYKQMLKTVTNQKSFTIAGDSAGGAMIITIMRKARDANFPLPVAGLSISPWANLTHTGASIKERNGLDQSGTTFEALDLLAKLFLGDTLPSDPDASPVFADVRNLPPILIQIGENEVMLSDAIRLASHLAENRVKVTFESWPNMFHVWHQYTGFLPEADEAIKNSVNFIEREINRNNIK